MGRFINADALVATGQGPLGNNMFAYCRNNPVTRYDICGYCDNELVEKNDDEVEVAPHPNEAGSGMGASSTVGTAPSGGSNGAGNQGNIQSSAKVSSAGYQVIDGTPANETTEVHHIVERCQSGKSGFSMVDIDGTYNKVLIPQSVHRKISGHYSSIQPYSEGLRVRNWLAGQPFGVQQAYGWGIIDSMWRMVYG